MAIKKEEFKDAYLGELPVDLQNKLADINKLIVAEVNKELQKAKYDSIRDKDWAKNMLKEFFTAPKDKSEVGAARVYKKGKRYRCMIQVTGHAVNNRETEDEELFHGLIRNTHIGLRAKIRRKYDATLTCESEHGEHFEGYDVWTKQDVAKSLWERFEDKPGKPILPMKESTCSGMIVAGMNELPAGLQRTIMETSELLTEKSHGKLKHSFRMAINKENGHFVKIVFDLNKDDVSFVGSHDGTNPVEDKYQDKIIKNINKTGYTDFVSKAKVLAIVDMDTNERLNSVSATGVMSGLQSFASKPLAEREKLARDETTKLRGGQQYVAGQVEGADENGNMSRIQRRSTGTYKSTKPASSIDDLSKFQAEPIKYGRGYHKESSDVDDEDIFTEGLFFKSKREKELDTAISKITGSKPKKKKEYEKDASKWLSSFIDDNIDDIKKNFYKPEKETYFVYTGANSIGPYLELDNGKLKFEFPYLIEAIIKESEINKVIDKLNKLNDIVVFKAKIDDDLPGDDNGGAWGYYINAGIVEGGPEDSNDHGNDKDENAWYDWLMKQYDAIDKSPYKCYEFQAVVDAEPLLKNEFYTIKESSIGYTELRQLPSGEYTGTIVLSEECTFDDDSDIIDFCCEFNDVNGTKNIVYNDDEQQFEFTLTPEYAQKLYEYLDAGITPIDEFPIIESYAEDDDIIWDAFTEANNPTPEYNTEMSESEAKNMINKLTADIINNTKQVTQYTANIFANIITKNLLPLWAKGYKKISITVDPKIKSKIMEFKIPAMTQDFISRFVEGREPIQGFLHRNPEIKIIMNPDVFSTLKKPIDGFNFFRSAIKYYDTGIEKYSEKLMAEVMKLPRDIKRLVSTSKLSGIVTLPMQMFVTFDNVNMSSTDMFKISKDDLKSVTKFIRSIYTNYAAPEKEKAKIIEDLKKVIAAITDTTGINENTNSIRALPINLSSYFEGVYKDELIKFEESFIRENIDTTWSTNQKNPEVRLLQEKFGVKKLKKIPRDLVAYITIETEAIRDSNDKMLIASYCLAKLEIVEWYIELLEVGSKKYIVPHSKPYLEAVRTQLLKCYKDIMNTKIVNPANRPLFDIQYPKGYEG